MPRSAGTLTSLWTPRMACWWHRGRSALSSRHWPAALAGPGKKRRPGMREIVLDTETTGVEANGGDRVVEIGCVELVNHCPSGRTFHQYINPERAMAEGAFKVHGLSDAFLADKPVFAAIAEEFAAFIDGARLVIHNASFDVGFLNMEMKRVGRGPIDPSLVVDTLAMARRKHPGASNSLD